MSDSPLSEGRSEGHPSTGAQSETIKKTQRSKSATRVASPPPTGFDPPGTKSAAPVEESSTRSRKTSADRMARYINHGSSSSSASRSDSDTSAPSGNGETARELEEASAELRNRYQNEPAPGDADAAKADPIDRVVGHSIQLAELLDWRGSDGLSYVSPNASRVLLLAAGLARAAEPSGRPLVTMREVLHALILTGNHATVTASPFAQEVRILFPIPELLKVPDPAEIRIILASEEPGPNINRESNLRWDVVEVLAEASRLRLRTNPLQREIGLRHIFLAAFRVKTGQISLRESGFFRPNFDDCRSKILTIKHRDFQKRYRDDPAAWKALFGEIGGQASLVRMSGTESRASYASDRVAVEPGDPLGIATDAKALADLILLDAARPPLAIGVFGSWGSGKSTLIAHLKEQIRQQLVEERELRKRRESDQHPETKRVGNVLQLDFNAWTFADSPNLWASFASEIFDQLAAGGVDQASKRHGAKLVAEVTARTTREMVSLRIATAAIAQNEAGMAAALTILNEAKRTADSAIFLAAADTARDLLGVKPDKPADRVYVSFDQPEKEKDRQALKVFRDAVLGSESDKQEKVIARYAESAGAIVRWFKFVFDYLASSWQKALSVLGGTMVLLLVGFWIWRFLDLPTLWKFGASLSVIVVWGTAAYRIVLPAIRFAALYTERLEERRREARAAVAKAQAELASYLQARDAAEQARQTSKAFIAQYGAAADPTIGASPGLMLDYLVKESESVAAVRAREGMLAIVRRAFDQLDAVIRQMQTDHPAEAVDRIVLYIDDLDRCSAKQVTDILQAIHLLLAFECFVVVAAVDARWLRHSLESHHEQFAVSKNGVDPVMSPDMSSDRPTAADYLEKIFQVAFWVRPLTDNDAEGDAQYAPFARYVDHLFGAVGPTEEVRQTNPTDVDTTVPAAAPSEFIIVEPASPADLDLPRRERLQITPDEQALFKKLGPLAAKSPRAVKRMINIYRLIRVGYRDDTLAFFLTSGATRIPTYRSVLFALACEMGLPSTLAAAFDLRVRTMTSEEWQRFINKGITEDDGTPLKAGISFGKGFPELARLAQKFETMRMLHRFQHGLVALRDHQAQPMRQADMILALDDVRRYSFRLE